MESLTSRLERIKQDKAEDIKQAAIDAEESKPLYLSVFAHILNNTHDRFYTSYLGAAAHLFAWASPKGKALVLDVDAAELAAFKVPTCFTGRELNSIAWIVSGQEQDRKASLPVSVDKAHLYEKALVLLTVKNIEVNSNETN